MRIEALSIEAAEGERPCADAAAMQTARQHLENVLQPGALTLMVSDAVRRWPAARWHHLARRVRLLPFSAADAPAHAAALWLQAGEWAAEAGAVEGVESWRRKPQPLA